MRKLFIVAGLVGLFAIGPISSHADDGLRLIALTASRVTAALGFTPLNPANNLSDVGSVSSALTNLGLVPIGTSGNTIPELSGNNTFSGLNTFSNGLTVNGALNVATGNINNGSNQVTSQYFAASGTYASIIGNDRNSTGNVTIYRNYGATYIVDSVSGTLLSFASSSGKATLPFSLSVGSATAPTLATGEFGIAKTTASGTAPGAGALKMAVVAGTNSGTCKIIAYAGTSTTPVTIVDNVGSGC